MEEYCRNEYYGSFWFRAVFGNKQYFHGQIGTHADSLVAEAVVKNISSGFDLELAWEAVWKDATVGPKGDGKVQYADREEVCTNFSYLSFVHVVFHLGFDKKNNFCLLNLFHFRISQNVDFEVRAGLNSVYNDPTKGWVADDIHSESASRTLAYACASYHSVMDHIYQCPHFVIR